MEEKMVSTRQEISFSIVIFHKLDFPVSTSRKKSLNKRIPFQLNRKSGMENSFKKTFLLEGKILPLTGISEISKQMVANGSFK